MKYHLILSLIFFQGLSDKWLAVVTHIFHTVKTNCQHSPNIHLKVLSCYNRVVWPFKRE